MLSKKILMLSLSAFILTSVPAFAKKGTESGGGGDNGEMRVNEIRADLKSWIENGGAENLKLPPSISYGSYVDNMTDILAPKKVLVTFIEKDSDKDPELKVDVSGKPKTCRGFVSRKTKKPNILCNIKRFSDVTPSEQYKLIHHEYAGLVLLEKNEGAASDYELSNQLAENMEYQFVPKLAIKKKGGIKLVAEATETQGNIVEFLDPRIVYFGKELKISFELYDKENTNNLKFICSNLGMKLSNYTLDRTSGSNLFADFTRGENKILHPQMHTSPYYVKTLSCSK